MSLRAGVRAGMGAEASPVTAVGVVPIVRVPVLAVLAMVSVTERSCARLTEENAIAIPLSSSLLSSMTMIGFPAPGLRRWVLVLLILFCSVMALVLAPPRFCKLSLPAEPAAVKREVVSAPCLVAYIRLISWRWFSSRARIRMA